MVIATCVISLVKIPGTQLKREVSSHITLRSRFGSFTKLSVKTIVVTVLVANSDDDSYKKEIETVIKVFPLHMEFNEDDWDDNNVVTNSQKLEFFYKFDDVGHGNGYCGMLETGYKIISAEVIPSEKLTL